ncbi:MAG TPA: hypothetical protein VJC16_07960 [Candidatus Nanoarchaeia archaeon]|nr:hypothetical protein [Candidatus Nanoarchaeia archaeon]
MEENLVHVMVALVIARRGRVLLLAGPDQLMFPNTELRQREGWQSASARCAQDLLKMQVWAEPMPIGECIISDGGREALAVLIRCEVDTEDIPPGIPASWHPTSTPPDPFHEQHLPIWEIVARTR